MLATPSSRLLSSVTIVDAKEAMALDTAKVGDKHVGVL